MGDSASNVLFGPHTVAGSFVGYCLVFHQKNQGLDDWSDPISAAERASLLAAAAQSQAAFNGAATGFWGNWYSLRGSTQKEEARTAVLNY